MPDPCWTVIFNPTSGGGRVLQAELESALAGAGLNWRLLVSHHAKDAEQLAEQAAQNGERRFACAGGDGTINQVVNGLATALGPDRLAEVELGVLPIGTGNDWARSLGIPRQLAAACRLLHSNHRTAVDLGVMVYPASDHQRLFVNAAGCGFDAHIATIMDGQPKDRWYYLRGLFRGLRSYCPTSLRVQAEGLSHEGPCLLVVVALGRWFGAGLRVAPHARLDDGRFELVIVPRLSTWRILAHLPALLWGDVSKSPWITVGQCQSIEIAGLAATQAEGEPAGMLPVRIHLLPAALPVVSPETRQA